MGFNLIARPYAALERLVFGGALQRARCVHLEQLVSARRILLLGDGDGRFLKELLATGCRSEIISVDASERMLQVAQGRCGSSADGVQFVCAPVLEYCPPPGFAADVITAHFFLDCFDESGLDAVARRIKDWIAPGGSLVVADFALPESGCLRRLSSRFLIWTMLRFFRTVARIPARRLLDIRAALVAAGWRSGDETALCKGLIRCGLWGLGSRERA